MMWLVAMTVRFGQREMFDMEWSELVWWYEKCAEHNERVKSEIDSAKRRK